MRPALLFAKLLADRKGATAIEYGMILALIAICIVASVGALGRTTGNLFSFVEKTYRTSTGQ